MSIHLQQNKENKCFQPKNTIWLMYCGLFLSQTQLLGVSNSLLQMQQNSMFSLIYFLTSTFILINSMFSIVFGKTVSRYTLDFFEYPGIIVSSIVLVNTLNSNNDKMYSIALVLQFIVQFAAVAVKTISFGGLSEDLAEISNVARIVRLAKIIIKVLIIIANLNILVLAITTFLLQLVSVFIVFNYFSYQWIFTEHLFCTGTILGLISCIDFTASIVFNSPYCLLGEVSYVICFLLTYISIYPFIYPIEVKYKNKIGQKFHEKTDDDHLVSFLLIRENLLEEYNSLDFSEETKNFVILNAVDVLKFYYGQKFENQNNVTLKDIYNEMKYHKKKFFQNLLMVVHNLFRNTENMNCLEAMVKSNIFLQNQQSLLKGFVFFHRFLENNKNKKSALELIRLKNLHSSLIKPLEQKQENHKKTTSLIYFNDQLNILRKNIYSAFKEEVKLIEFLQGNDLNLNQQNFPEQKLLKRFENKQTIREIIDKCTKDNSYVHNNQLKFLILLFGVGLEKNAQMLVQKLKNMFFSLKAVEVSLGEELKALMLIKGLGRGQILKCSQTFNKSIQNCRNNQKLTINDFIPSKKQANRHTDLMNLAYDYQDIEKTLKHSQYSCFLHVDKKIKKQIFKALQQFKISTHLYCDYQQGFNYVCFFKQVNKNSNIINIAHKQSQHLKKKGLIVDHLSVKIIEQLGQEMKILSIQTQESEPPQQQESYPKKNSREGDKFNQEKIEAIQNKIISDKHTNYQLSNVFEILVVLGLICFQGVSVVVSIKQIYQFESILVNDIWALKISTVINGKTVLESSILHIVNGSAGTFPDSMCQANNIQNMTSFLVNQLTDQLFINYKPFLDRFNRGEMNKMLIPQILSPNYTTKGITWAGNIGNTTYIKMIQLIKSFQSTMITGKAFGIYNSFMLLKYYIPLYQKISLSGLQKIYAPIKEQILLEFEYFSYLMEFIRVVLCLVTIVSVAILSFLRVKGNNKILGYYNAVLELKEDTLKERLKEVKKIIHTIKKSIKDVPEVDIDLNRGVSARVNNKQTKMFQSLDEFGRSCPSQQFESRVSVGDQESLPLLGSSSKIDIKTIHQSHLFRLFRYSRCYLFLMLVVLLGILAFSNLFVQYQKDKVKNLQAFYHISEQTSHLQHQYTNLLAHNWFKALSIQSGISPHSYADMLLSQAMASFRDSKFVQLMEQLYPEQYSLPILNQKVCRLFQNETFCQNFRGGIFTHGFSNLLPLTIKDQKDMAIFSTVYSDYFILLCDSTSLLFQGVVPVTEKIPVDGYNYSEAILQERIPVLVAILVIEMLIVLALPIIYQCSNHGKLTKIRQEILSLDSVAILYKESTLKPYFNKIYYN